MKFLFFDTETTGLPKNRKIPACKESGNWPDIVSISWVIKDEFQRTLKSSSALIYPTSWIIPKESVDIHGISQELAEKEGKDIGVVLREFVADMAGCDYVIAHNMEFDSNVVSNAYIWRAKSLRVVPWPPKICSAEEGKSITKINYAFKWGNAYRFPKLYELYTKLIGKPPGLMLHNSLNDTLILSDLFYHLPRFYAIMAENVPPVEARTLHITLGDSI
jgi:hypothetical protein